ncbi:MAG: tyrosine--tRNA ligase [Nanoarchaeota archaeon]|nr:tyrosine--tRNA ligase [Nanoarchaeota archaeon]
MDIQQRIDLIKEVGEEILTEEELKTLLETKKKPIAYDGFEPSGHAHIAQGILRAINVNKMIKAGCTFKMYAADWHGWTNMKFGGDLEKIQTAGDYLIEVWKASGMDVDQVEFIRAIDLIDNQDYWKKVIRIAQHSTVNRIIRCGQIMGRKEAEVQQASQIIYPCMQAADIFELEADITQLGMDQRKVNILARELGPKLGYWKPVVVSHHMLQGLGKPASEEQDATERAIDMKMSKSKPETAIFMTDTEEDVTRKINNAYCPAGQLKDNPLAEYLRYIIFEKNKTITIERDKKFGGDITFEDYQTFATTYQENKIHPLDVKKTVALYINKLLDPVRKHFTTNNKAKQLLEQVKSFQITR